MKHTKKIIRVAVIDRKEFSKEALSALKGGREQEQGIIFVEQLCPNGYNTDFEIQDTPVWQELDHIKYWLQNNGFNAFEIAEEARTNKIMHINEFLDKEAKKVEPIEITLTRADLHRAAKELRFEEITRFHMKNSSMTIEQFNTADLVVFVEGDKKKVLKDRGLKKK